MNYQKVAGITRLILTEKLEGDLKSQIHIVVFPCPDATQHEKGKKL